MRKILAGLALAAVAFGAEPRPKVRAITAFVNIDSRTYTSVVEDTVKFLNVAREAYRAAGYDVETIRIVTQPFPKWTAGMNRADALALVGRYAELGTKLGFTPNIGTAMVTDSDDAAPVDLLADILSTGIKTNASLIVAGEDGIHWRAIGLAARMVKAVSVRSPHGGGNLNFATAAMVKPYTPFYPAAYHLGTGHTFAVGLESANVVADIFAQYKEPGESEKQLAAALAKHARAAEVVAVKVATSSGWTYAGIDPTPAPLGDVSIGRAIENFTGSPFGSGGTMTAAAIITRAVKAAPVKQIGYSGLMVPILEDNGLAKRWEEGTFNIDSLLAYSAVCAGGLDTVPLRGDITEQQIARILGDVASLAYKWNKPLAARLLPAPGKKAGDRTEFEDSRMANTVVR